MTAVEYIYCIVPATFDLGDSISGIDGQPVRLIPHGDIAAVASTLDGEIYPIADIERHVGDVEWLKPRAIAHDQVVTLCSDRSPTIPMPMWSLFSDALMVVDTLETRADALRAYLEKIKDAREYTVRLFVHLQILQPVLSVLSPRFAELEHSITGASPGQAYLLQRKIDAERKLELRNITRQVATETYAALSAQAVESIHDPVTQGESDGQAVLNASFLVANAQFEAFRQALTDLVTRYGPSGFRFDFTGPWPPYHFVHGR